MTKVDQENGKKVNVTQSDSTRLVSSRSCLVVQGESTSPTDTYICLPCALSVSNDIMHNNDILFDCAANEHLFGNANLLTNIRESNKVLTFSGISSDITTNMIGDTENFGSISYHHLASSNVLSQSKIVDMGHEVTYYKQRDYYEVICVPSGDVYYFTRKNGLYVFTAVPYDTYSNTVLAVNTAKPSSVVPGNVASIEAQYSKREVDAAKEARLLEVKMRK